MGSIRTEPLHRSIILLEKKKERVPVTKYLGSDLNKTDLACSKNSQHEAFQEITSLSVRCSACSWVYTFVSPLLLKGRDRVSCAFLHP